MSGPERQQTTRIDVKDLIVRYAGDVVAVNGVSFTVGKSEHVTLLGPSGCGKTTTLRAIAGLEPPSSGSIHIDSRAVYAAHMEPKRCPPRARSSPAVGTAHMKRTRNAFPNSNRTPTRQGIA